MGLYWSENVEGTCNVNEEGGRLSPQRMRRSAQEGRIPGSAGWMDPWECSLDGWIPGSVATTLRTLAYIFLLCLAYGTFLFIF